MTTSTVSGAEPVAITDQLPLLTAQAAGYVGHRTIAMGLRTGLLRAVNSMPAATPEQLAAALTLDSFYTSVWCQAAFAAGVLERRGGGYELAPHMATLLLDGSSAAHVGALFPVLEQAEIFDQFEKTLATGERTWWNRTSAEWIAGVAAAGTPFYIRLIPGGLCQVPGLSERLRAGCRVMDTSCGAGVGLSRLATTYPACELVGVDGDARSIELAQARVDEAGIADRIVLSCCPLEQLTVSQPVTLAISNISMHECRDLDRATDNIASALEPGGWFVISDFPFPDNDSDLRTPAGRIMSGIQLFEARIDDQLLPRSAYDDLLDRHGFTEIGSFGLTAMHAVTYGRWRS